MKKGGVLFEKNSFLFRSISLVVIATMVIGSFIYYCLDRIGLNNLIFGSGQPLITGKQLKELEFTIPSQPEQQKIADSLSSLDELIATQAHKLDTFKVHKKGLMQQLFPNPDEVNG